MPEQKIVIISGPSGAGKSSIVNGLKNIDKRFRFTVSATTRPKRPEEVDGKDYFFITEKKFKTRIKNNEFIEWENVHNNLYGTQLDQFSPIYETDEIILMDIDTKGAINIKKHYSEALLIFIEPLSPDILIKRLNTRKTESGDIIETRMQRVTEELKLACRFDKHVINDELPAAVNEVYEIVTKRFGK